MTSAANGSFEPVLPNFSFLANGCCRDFARNVQQPLGFGTEFVAAEIELVRACSKTSFFCAEKTVIALTPT